ncbi:hypothetical protein [Terribacillus sp. 7520-G]|uniref:hypothetical protein n=1 Tax=Terribacillus sp. 7520-G TaxID=2025389 RepID=UPI00117F6981|nr:hypothetical protein [Terribacillus sp. 7520-G]
MRFKDIDTFLDAKKEFDIRVRDGSTATKESLGTLGLEVKDVLNNHGASIVLQKINQLDDEIAKVTTGIGLFGAQFEDIYHQA